MRAARFSQADINRAVAAVKKAWGSAVVEIAPNGTIRVVPAELSPQVTGEPGADQVARKKEIVL